jgi:hypothetical protein
VQRLNDPGTHADELLGISKWAIRGLLIFTGLLGGISYFKNFSQSLPFEVAVLLALVITAMIEVGKNYYFTWTIRIPFFQGFGHIWKAPANTIIWIGMMAITGVTFAMSVYNSTIGGEQLALMLSHEKQAQNFAPVTSKIDTMIADARKAQVEHGKSNWKGRLTPDAIRAIKSESRTIEALQRQRETSIQQQRADWEKQVSIQEGHASFAAKLVMASGGWVELLQALLMLVRVACEKTLDGRLASPTPSSNGGIGFRQNPVFAAENGQGSQTAERRYPGFNVDQQSGNVRSAAKDEDAQTLPGTPAYPLIVPMPVDLGSRNLAQAMHLPPLVPASITEDVIMHEDGLILFKQSGELFKQIRNTNGIVIGLQYQGPKMKTPTTMSYSQVRSRISSYRNNAARDPQTREKMIELWQYALSLFEVPEDNEQFKPITTV